LIGVCASAMAGKSKAAATRFLNRRMRGLLGTK